MAIKPEELRIGNWVNAPKLVVLGSCKSSECNDMLPFQVPYLTQTDHQIKLYEPIPLTPDILENNFGFKWSGADHWEKDELWVEDYKGGYRIVRPNFCHTIFKTAHHFQNLYFALTNTELNYTPNKK